MRATTLAVASGRRATACPPLSSNVYISFSTTSVIFPTVRSKSFTSSRIGVSIRPNEYASAISRALRLKILPVYLLVWKNVFHPRTASMVFTALRAGFSSSCFGFVVIEL